MAEKEINSNDFKEVYEELGIDLRDLGCVMLDIEKGSIPQEDILKLERNLYKSEDPKKYWINGFVAGDTPHITLLYGLLENARNYEKHIERVLQGWELPSVTVEAVDFFESPYEDEPYYCVIAKIKTTPELLEGHHRLEFLPHINTYPTYKPHLTIAYIPKDPLFRHEVVGRYESLLVGKELPIISGLNLGDVK